MPMNNNYIGDYSNWNVLNENKKKDKKESKFVEKRKPEVEFLDKTIRLHDFSPGNITLDAELRIKNNANVKIKVIDYDVNIFCNNIILGTAKKANGSAKLKVNKKKKEEGYQYFTVNAKLTDIVNMGKILTSIAAKAFSDPNKKVFYIAVRGIVKVQVAGVKVPIKLDIPKSLGKFNIKDWVTGNIDQLNKYLKAVGSSETVQSIKKNASKIISNVRGSDAVKTVKTTVKKVAGEVEDAASSVYDYWTK